MEELNDKKECENHCPQCGAGIDDIEWGKLENDETISRAATCKKCDCEFVELYQYIFTAYNEYKPKG